MDKPGANVDQTISSLNLELQRCAVACAALQRELNVLAESAKASNGAIEGTLLLKVAKGMRDAAQQIRATAAVIFRDPDGLFQTRVGGSPE